MARTEDRPPSPSRVPDRWRHPTGWRRAAVATGLVGLAAVYGFGFWGYIHHHPPLLNVDGQFGLLRSDGKLAVFSCVKAPNNGVGDVALAPLNSHVRWRAVVDRSDAADAVPIATAVPGYRIETDGEWTPTGVVEVNGIDGESGELTSYIREFDTNLIEDGSALTADGEVHSLTDFARRFPECRLPLGSS